MYQGELTRETAGFRIARTPRVIWKGTGGVWPEAPHLYRRGGWYYLVTAEGGTSYGHSVVVARSRAPYGPFEPSPHGPLITHRGRPRHPIQATGHADLVDLEDGTTWAVFLGIRPTGGRHHHLGRETYLAPVHWRPDGWPRMPPIEPTMQGPLLPRSDAADSGGRLVFRRRRLPLEWCFVRNPVRGACSLRAEPGFLRLWGGAATLDDVASPSLVCRRQEHLEMTARARTLFEAPHGGERAGICVRANETFHAALVVAAGRRGRELRLECTVGGVTTTVGRRVLGAGPVTVEIEATAQEYRFGGGTGRVREVGRRPDARLLGRVDPREHRPSPLHRGDHRPLRDGRREESDYAGALRVVRVRGL